MAVGSTGALVAQCRAQLDAGRVDEALPGLIQVYGEAAAARQWSVAAWAANWVGHVHEHHLGDLAPALLWFGRAERAAANSTADLPRTRAMARFNAGLVEARRGRTTVALAHFEVARVAAAASGDGGLEATCAERAGSALCELGRWADGLSGLDQAGQLATGAGDAGLAAGCTEQAAEAVKALAAPPAAQFDRLARAGLDRTLAAAGPAEPARILDAGCGSGDEVCIVAARWPAARVLGADLTETVRSIRLPRDLRRRVEVRAIDLTVAGPETGGFDLVVCNAVLHTVAAPEALLATLARVLRPGGQLVGATFTDAYYRRLRGDLGAAGIALPRPAISHTEAEIGAALTSAGFANVELWTEAVELRVEGPGAAAHLERLLGRPLDAGEAGRVLDATGRPLRLDLAPLHFSATAP
jgi:SAM-dependent methyltransferase